MDKLPPLYLILITIGIHFTSSDAESRELLFRRAGTIRSSSSVQELAARSVLRRLLPSHLSSFEFKIVSEDVCGGRSCFWIQNYKSSANTSEIMIQGTTAVDILSGLHWYLKYSCQAHVSWEKTGGAQLASIPNPGFLPRVEDKGVKIKRQVPWSYYQNVVTSSYSFVWWNWTRWEKEIDWMALEGINLPLAFTGQETIWQKVFMDFNITTEDLNDFFAGPAFLSWSRMGNLHGWGGPLSQHWLNQQLTLQKKIIIRMVKLGMTPVLPSFSGNVPAALKSMYPSANITRLGDWNTVNGDPRWCCTYLLDPSDPLFVEIGKTFIRKQLKEYGDVTNLYNCDTFNENLPPTNDPSYISSLGAAVYRGMSSGNSDAIWLMQGWLFSSDSMFWKPSQMKALLHSVPFGKMIVLDLFADVKPIWKGSSHFYGTPYIWCMLHNFGGNIEMYGILDTVSSQPIDARKNENSTMVGVGMCMEGIEQNPVVYELMSEMAFRKDIVPVHDWLRGYVRRRYGKAVQEVEVAWEILYRTIYNCTDGIADHNKDFIVMFPEWIPALNPILKLHYPAKGLGMFQRFSLKEDSYSPKSHSWYSNREVVSALKLLLDAANDLSKSRAYQYDLVDLSRQVLSKLANDVYFDAITAFQQGDEKLLTLHSRMFIQLIKDIDELLASNENFLLGTWLESAKNMANDEDEMRQYEWNARTQVTMWFDTASTNQSKLHDYANKFWSGLLQDYYLPRASIYFSSMLRSLRMKKSFSLEEWRREWISFSNEWQADTKRYPVNTRGDSVAISTALYHKYFG